MNVLSLCLLFGNAAFLLTLPRKWAVLPLLIGACYTTLGSGFSIGPFSFTVLRALMAVCIIRFIARSERIEGPLIKLDYLVVCWGIWCTLSGLLHNNPVETFIFRLGRTYNIAGFYFLIRILCRDRESIIFLCKAIALLLTPIALEMLSEQTTQRNLFAYLGDVESTPIIRDGKLRAQGPFGHAILAGTVGAACLPFVTAIWKTQKKTALLGIAACGAMVVSSVSSGPYMTLAGAIGASILWRFQGLTKWLRRGAVLTYLIAEIVMNRPAYYLISKIDLTGSSTAYFRSRLIESSIEHLDEWWLAGTDYTRHWMPTGVTWSPDHTDITNQYIAYGVWGGLPLMGLFIAMLTTAFIYVGIICRNKTVPEATRFLVWMMGATLFAHAMTFVSVAYFDQSYVFIYIALGAIGSVYSHETRWIKKNEHPDSDHQATPNTP